MDNIFIQEQQPIRKTTKHIHAKHKASGEKVKHFNICAMVRYRKTAHTHSNHFLSRININNKMKQVEKYLHKLNIFYTFQANELIHYELYPSHWMRMAKIIRHWQTQQKTYNVKTHTTRPNVNEKKNKNGD